MFQYIPEVRDAVLANVNFDDLLNFWLLSCLFEQYTEFRCEVRQTVLRPYQALEFNPSNPSLGRNSIQVPASFAWLSDPLEMNWVYDHAFQDANFDTKSVLGVLNISRPPNMNKCPNTHHNSTATFRPCVRQPNRSFAHATENIVCSVCAERNFLKICIRYPLVGEE
jgi:hypothetical protein